MDVIMGGRYWVIEEEHHGVVIGFCSDLALILFDSGGEKWVLKSQMRVEKRRRFQS